MSEEQEFDEIDRMLSQLQEEAGSMINTCEYQSSFQKYGEVRQRAKQAGRAFHFVNGTFFQMDQSQYLFEFTTMRERAIELISVLSDFEQLLKIQPDVPPEYFDYAVYQMRPCGYENLAEATGMMEGYNSDGLHDCIADGLQVCRSVGKLGCINCFREYACDVYLAADDFELARHQCQTVVSHEGEWQARGNRRWLAQKKLAWIDSLCGDLEAAQQGYEKSLALTSEKDVGIPLEAKFKAMVELDSVRIVQSLDPLMAKDPIKDQLPAVGECLYFDMKNDWNVALQAAMAKEFSKADELYSKWESTLRSKKATHYWFENRLRHIALKRLSGDANAAEVLAETVEDRAKEANDWLTIRRLNDVLGNESDPSPLGTATRQQNAATETASSANEDAAKSAIDDATKVSDETDQRLTRFNERMVEAFESQDADNILKTTGELAEELIQVNPEQSEAYQDTAAYLGAMQTLIGISVEGKEEAIWKWANRMSAPHRNNGYILSMLAATGFYLARQMESDGETENKLITEERLRQLFKQSLKLVDDGPGTYFRAGEFFEAVGDVGEAERCYARSFKLDRRRGETASRLAGLYSETERPRDALHVLDLCLREGTDDANVGLQAVRLALEVGQHEATMTYLERLLEFEGVEDRSPLPYFRALAHVGLGDGAAALREIDREQAEAEKHFHCHAVRACAAALSGDESLTQESFSLAVNQDLREVDYLPPKDVVQLLTLMFEHLPKAKVPLTDSDRLIQRLLAVGEMPESYFEDLRKERDAVDQLHFFTMWLSQEMDDWESSTNCIPGTEQWDHYLARWGVLALDEEQAVDYVREVQKTCAQGEMRVLELTQESGPYTDSPGITFQGVRRYVPRDAMDFDSMFDDDDEDSDDN